MKKIELLAPVGSQEALVAAVWNGADAVYLSGKDFGARKFAANFDREALREAVKFCHRHGVSVFVTVNTLIADSEMDQLIDYLDFLYRADVDAVIVQDFGVLSLIKVRYPDFEIHVSTQMSAHSTYDIAYLEALGVGRVVLPREMPLSEIAKIRAKTDVDFECFVHGALCISYSGQCLMSSMIGGRSGNRGSCAQSCRQPYSLVDMESGLTQAHEGGKYLLSPKDLNALEAVPELIASGVNSFKIEGRMKRPEYAAVVVRAYRMAIDAALESREIDIEDLKRQTEAIFTRGFTGGHLLADAQSDRMNQLWPGNAGVEIGKVLAFDKDRKRMRIHIEEPLHVGDEIQIRRTDKSVGARVEFIEIGRARVKEAEAGQDVTMNMQYDVRPGETLYRTVNEVLLKQARATYARQVQRVPVKMEVRILKDTSIEMVLIDVNGNRASAKGQRPEPALKRALDKERVEAQVSKLGDTPYLVSHVNLELDEGLALPMKALNALRRECVEALDKMRETRYAHRADTVSHPIEENEEIGQAGYTYPTFNVQVYTHDQLLSAVDEGGVNILVSTLELLKEAIELKVPGGFKVYFAPGRIVRDFEFEAFEANIEIIQKADGLWAGTYGMLQWAQSKNLHVAGIGQGLNVFNRISVKAHCKAGYISTLSPEMTLEQIKAIDSGSCGLEAMVYGRQTVMVTEYCPISATLSKGQVGCGLCENNQYGLQDKKGAIFPVMRSNKQCRTQVLNSKILFVPEELDTLYDEGVRNYRMVFTLENGEEVQAALRYFKRAMDHELTQEDEKVKTRFVSMGLTRGHYHRGVFTEK